MFASFGQNRYILDSASGLTSTEAENAFALSIIECGKLSPQIVAREKAEEVKKNGLLEIVSTPESLKSIGGLELLKEWLLQRRDAFGKEAREYGLPAPKGILLSSIKPERKHICVLERETQLNNALFETWILSPIHASINGVSPQRL